MPTIAPEWLMLSGEPDDAPRREVPISISELSGKFGVSRVHVRRLLTDCVSGALLERTGAGSFRILPRLADAMRDLMAVYILHNAHCARVALAQARDERAVA